MNGWMGRWKEGWVNRLVDGQMSGWKVGGWEG
jgi:hypothetical protein